MSQHPYEKLVEALRKTKGFHYVNDQWWCPHCCITASIAFFETITPSHHMTNCPVRLALEAAPPTMPKPDNTLMAAKKAEDESHWEYVVNPFDSGMCWGCEVCHSYFKQTIRPSVEQHSPSCRYHPAFKPKPKCERCGDTKLLDGFDGSGSRKKYIGKVACPCIDFGPAPAKDDAPDKAEEIAREIQNERAYEQGAMTWNKAIVTVLRRHFTIDADRLGAIADDLWKHDSIYDGDWPRFKDNVFDVLSSSGVGQPIPLADLLADPRLRPVVEVVREAIKHSKPNAPYRPLLSAVDALPPELRAAIEPKE